MKRVLMLMAAWFLCRPICGNELRIGIIGCDTSHVPAFTECLNNPQAKNHIAGGRVVAAFRGGSPDLPDSWSRVDDYSRTLSTKYGVKFYDTIEELCQNVDAVMLESVDGRPHLRQMQAILRTQLAPATDKGSAGLLPGAAKPAKRIPVYIDKPMAGSLKDAQEIFRLARAAGVPVFSASSLRFGKATQAVRHGSLGAIQSAETKSPFHIEPHHPDLFYYAIHGVESLFTVMGPGCETVERRTTANGKLEVVGHWRGGRTGTYREDEGYGGLARGANGEAKVGTFDGYEPLVEEIIKFFQTGIVPVEPAETLEILAFMEAADESKRRGGAAVRLTEVPTREHPALYSYTLVQDGTPASYDESLAVACLQGIINRDSPELYVLSRKNNRPQYWLDLLSKDGRWLQDRDVKPVATLDALVGLAGDRLKGVVIWDPAVPASVNVATTIAGISNAVALSPEYAARYVSKWHLPVLKDLRGLFTGAETGSRKNDAYRWAIREYLAKGLCSAHWLCLYEDAYSTRARGDIGYVLTRDWAVKQRAFVYDLSPWGDEKPQDDPDQRLGLDLETYRLLLAENLRHSAGKQMTEVAGFFAFSKYSNMPDHKSAHEPVPTEWETVWLISPYNCYQNTVASDCFNQSLHSQAPRKPLHQHRVAKPVALENKTYVCILMADYDSATPLYEFLPNHWHNPARGQLPLAWGINPNLIETYPDLIAYFYSTATEADTFTSDASAAGYMNPNRVAPQYLPLFVKHNRKFFREADMQIAPMVLDWDQPSPAVKDAFRQFAPNGLATIVMDLHKTGGKAPEPQVWKDMPVMELLNHTCNFSSADQTAKIMSHVIARRSRTEPDFYFFRIVWTSPADIAKTIAALRHDRPDLNLEVLDPTTFCALFKQHYQRDPKSAKR